MTAAPTPSKHSRVEALDLLRLGAAVAVVAYHYTFRGAAGDDMTWLSLPALVPVTKYGFLGVQLFFVISGFVIAYSAEGKTVREFVIARATRILPGFLVAMTLTFLVILAFGAPRFETSLGQWLANLIIVAPALKQPFMDGAYWSIVYELVFYAWTAAIIACGLFPRRLPHIVIPWLLISLANELVIGSGALRRLLVTDDSGFFAAGLMLYALFSGRRSPLIWLLLAAATAAAALQADLDADWVRGHFAIELSSTVVAGLSVAAVGLVGGGLLIRRLPISAGVLIALGGLTYPLYLLHQMIGFVAFNRLQGVAPAAVLVIAVFAVMIGVSFVVYRYVERPGQKLMRKILVRILNGAPRRLPEAEPAYAMPNVSIFGPVVLPRAVLATSRPDSRA